LIHVRQIKKRPIPLFVEQSHFEQFTPTRIVESTFTITEKSL
jgi:hypothetical protein